MIGYDVVIGPNVTIPSHVCVSNTKSEDNLDIEKENIDLGGMSNGFVYVDDEDEGQNWCKF